MNANLNIKMSSLANRWKQKIQNQSAEELKFSMYSNHKQQASPAKIKQSATVPIDQISKNTKPRQQRQKSTKQDKLKYSRTKSSQQKKNISSKPQKNSAFVPQTPNKNINKRQDKLIQNCTQNILQLIDNRSGYQAKDKIKAVIEDLVINIHTQTNMNSSLKIGIGDRTYHQLQQKYLQSQKERQYLKGKNQLSSKRFQSLQRQLERYSKMQKMIDSSINRQNQLRQQITKLKTEKTQLQSQLQLQNDIFQKQKNAILNLIQELKMHLPIN